MKIQEVKEERGVRLVEIWPDQWDNFIWPEYQRTTNKARVNQIAKGIREGKGGPLWTLPVVRKKQSFSTQTANGFCAYWPKQPKPQN